MDRPRRAITYFEEACRLNEDEVGKHAHERQQVGLVGRRPASDPKHDRALRRQAEPAPERDACARLKPLGVDAEGNQIEPAALCGPGPETGPGGSETMPPAVSGPASRCASDPFPLTSGPTRLARALPLLLLTPGKVAQS